MSQTWVELPQEQLSKFALGRELQPDFAPRVRVKKSLRHAKLDLISVPRLGGLIDPFANLNLLGPRPLLEEVEKLKPARHRRWVNRTGEYDLPRIAFFVERLRQGRSIEPILLDNSTNTPYLNDGHHRFAAAMLLEYEWIWAFYHGRTDVREWLTKILDAPPSY